LYLNAFNCNAVDTINYGHTNDQQQNIISKMIEENQIGYFDLYIDVALQDLTPSHIHWKGFKRGTQGIAELPHEKDQDCVSN